MGVPVHDQALGFYVGVLGFEKVMDEPAELLGGRWIEVRPSRSSVTVALAPAGDRLPAGVDTGIRFTTGDAAALHADLSARGVDVDELPRWDGVPPMFDFRDPDGNARYVSEAG